MFQISSTNRLDGEQNPEIAIRPPLKPKQELQEILKEQRHFSICYLVKRVHKLLLSWFEDVFDELPLLNKIFMQAAQNEEIEAPNNTTAATIGTRDNEFIHRMPTATSMIDGLRGLVGNLAAKDSSNDEKQLWKRAKDGFIGRIRKKVRSGRIQPRFDNLKMQSSAIKLEFDPNREETNRPNIIDRIEGNEHGTEVDILQSRKRQRNDNMVGDDPPTKERKSQTKTYEGRRRWSDEEKLAVKKGFHEKGRDWVGIKNISFSALKNRTSGQLKVRKNL